MDWPYRTYSHSKGLFGWAYFSGELIFAGAHRRDNKVSLKQRKQSKIAAHPNSPWAYIREGVLSEA